MRHALLSFIILSSVLYSNCVPVPLDLDFSETNDYAPGKETKKYHDNSPEVIRVKEAHTLANKQIEAMHTIVNDYENKDHKAILNEHFGEHHDIKAIQKHVDMLRTGKVGIKVVRSNQPFEAWTKKQTGKVAFGLSFHSEDKTTQRRAGVLLHEATHALWDTKDRYKRVGEGENAHLQGIERVEYTNLEKDEGQREHLVKGYIEDGHLEELKKDKNMGSQMHMNADTWRAFGASAHDHIMKTHAQASGSGSGAGGSAPKRGRPDSDSRDEGPSSPKKSKEYGSSYNAKGTRSSHRLEKNKPHV